MPERELLVESKCKGKSYNTTVFSGLVGFYSIEYAVIFVLVEVGYLILNRAAAALFSAVS